MYKKVIILALSLILTMGITACGGQDANTDADTEPVTSEVAETEAVNNGPVEVDAIDADMTYEGTRTYFDDSEGYDREVTEKDSRSLQFIDYDVIRGTHYEDYEDKEVAYLVLHFREEFGEWGFFNADGTENTALKDSLERTYYSDTWYDLTLVQNATNVDTGKTEKLHLDDTCTEDFGIYEGQNRAYTEDIDEKILKWKNEKGLVPLAGAEENRDYGFQGEGWSFPAGFFEDPSELGGTQDLYYAYRLQNPTAPVKLRFRNDAGDVEEDYPLSTTKPPKQVMTIDVEQ